MPCSSKRRPTWVPFLRTSFTSTFAEQVGWVAHLLHRATVTFQICRGEHSMENKQVPDSKDGVSRRNFLKAAGALGGIALAGNAVSTAAAAVQANPTIEKVS